MVRLRKVTHSLSNFNMNKIRKQGEPEMVITSFNISFGAFSAKLLEAADNSFSDFAYIANNDF